MTCQEALRLLYEVIDKEADQIDTEEVKEHLNNCRNCMARYQFEQMFKTFVSEKAVSNTKTEQLRSRIRSQINQMGGKPTDFFNQHKRIIFSLAASLIIFAAVGLAGIQYYRYETSIHPFEEGHSNGFVTGTPISAVNANSYNAEGILPADFHERLKKNLPDYKLVHVENEEIIGKKFVHLHLLNGKAKISLYVSRATDMELPDFEKASFSGVEYNRHICSECQTIYWTKNNMTSVAVSENKNIDLPTVIMALEPI